MPFAVEIKNLKKTYPGALTPALDGLSLEVKRNSVTGLLGPNGAGKSTTINILCGLLHPDSGMAKVLRENSTTHTQQIRQHIGIVPQQIALFPNLTAWENFQYIGRLYGLNKQTVIDRAGMLLKRLDMDKHADKRVVRYSGGMKRRANIIASLLHHPDMIILDEPTAGVDVQSRSMILDFLKEYNQQEKTILYTSHHLEEAEKICEEVVIIDEGKNIVNGAPKELIDNTPNCNRLEDVFLHYTGHSVRD